MNVAIDGSARQYWLGALTGGGPTGVPRWSQETRPGVGEHVEPIPVRLVDAVSRTVGPLRGAPLLAAHAVVLAALSGEREVTTGYAAAAGAAPLPLRLTTEPATWRALVQHAARAQERLQANRVFPVDALATELGRTTPLFEVEVDLHGGAEAPAPHTALRLSVEQGAEELQLRLHYRTDVLDADSASRIAGYHLTALAAMAADPDAEHGGRSLLSAQEYAFQIDGLAGPDRELPAERLHELFEQRAAAHPGAVAAEHGGRQWTYRELNARANRLGRALLARGLRREGVVAVVTERNLDWMAAVLAIFKAGGVYLPIEPHFPAGRIATTLARAGCALALTEPGSDVTLRQALDTVPGAQAVLFEQAYAEDHADGDLGVPVAAGQLAYIYFTSGSTGQPKGAMCEHAGMINHLYAKIEDLGIDEGTVVAQTAPQCFDISLWQLVSALLVGGQTLLVPQEVILDVERFVEQITARRVGVLQVVPSYLEVIAAYLEQHPRELPDLRAVSATGEALKYELIQRWFAVAPGIPLVNAYGLTETSDDTNHEVMRDVPASGRVPLGRPVRNVRVYVVDENLDPVPLGAPGLIVFSGVCVGRGYVNDPERTRQAYLGDPHRPGQRLYRSGDYGRWLPDGRLEFLGRRDDQVKIRGFRIEIGEIDNALLRVPGVRDGAVVVAERPDRSKHLVAFYAAGRPIDPDVLTAHLAERLPEYMVPSLYHRRESLPLTANSKIDTNALRALAAELAARDEDEASPPATTTEQMLAAAFAKVLEVPVGEVGRHDHFFDRGGTSLTAVRLVIATGRAVSLKDVTRQPVLAELAALIDRRSAA
ncbi:non-ribosomal peptide synthetase [Pseudonocardia lacus]|uniref:non-ribosomal peptide synthetase n=1 Tax=Pseudonocardia lacus TaxID=2835865 RepID=UPI001BDBD307|nr:amino acid adenylation domain-containing protein [Pseudonocardia lacus]